MATNILQYRNIHMQQQYFKETISKTVSKKQQTLRCYMKMYLYLKNRYKTLLMFGL